MNPRLLPLLIFAGLALVVGRSAGDTVTLSGGGAVSGKVPEKQGRTTVHVELEGGGRLVLERSQVASISSESPAEVEYRRRAPTAPDTVESQWALAQWCKQQGLKSPLRVHLERVVELDPNHGEARTLLGHQQHNGRWMSRQQMMAARGMVRYDGDYRTRQEIVLLEAAKRNKETNASWKERLTRWLRNLNARDPDRVQQAIDGLNALDDPSAGPELAKLLLAERTPRTKALLIRTAARVRHGACVTALSKLALDDNNEEARMVCLEMLAKMQVEGLPQPFIKALRSKDNQRVNRAAAALEALEAPEAIAPLVDAVVTTHRFVPQGGAPGAQTYTMRQDGGFSFGDNRPKPVNRPVNNPRVRTALIRLTGVDFQYNKQAWRDWLASQATEAPVDLRRDG
ncbi:MAG: HEAT repeat domain-containing protein [Planctomycetota bacterium]